MADDPRLEPVATAIIQGPMECIGHGLDLLSLTHSVLRAADAVDPLRALLADEDRALELMTRTWFEAELGVGAWNAVAKPTKARQIDAMRPVLAALREVAGL